MTAKSTLLRDFCLTVKQRAIKYSLEFDIVVTLNQLRALYRGAGITKK